MSSTPAAPRPPYQRPTIEELGSFVHLTLGSKWQSISDLQSGQVAPGPGS